MHKLVSKVIANRLKFITREIISDNQSAFLLVRLISDDIVLTYEMSHFLKQKSSGGACFAALTFDITKTYKSRLRRVEFFGEDFVAVGVPE